MNISLNLNDEVHIKLTDAGRKIMESAYSELGLVYRRSVDKDGYTMFHLWEVMQEFGPYMFLGCSMPFETEIRLDVVLK